MKKITSILLVLFVCFFTMYSSSVTAAELDKGMVSVTFDDGEANLYSQALPALTAYKIPATAFIVPDRVGDGSHVTWSQLWTLFWTNAWEIGNHGPHVDLSALTTEEIINEVRNSQNTLIEHGFPNPGALAYPFGAFDESVIDALGAAGCVSSGRQAWTEDEAINKPDTFNRWALNVVSVRSYTTYAQIKAQIDRAVLEKGFLILVFHSITSATPADEYEVRASTLRSIASYLNSQRSLKKIDVVTISDGVAKMQRFKNLTP